MGDWPGEQRQDPALMLDPNPQASGLLFCRHRFKEPVNLLGPTPGHKGASSCLLCCCPRHLSASLFQSRRGLCYLRGE